MALGRASTVEQGCLQPPVPEDAVAKHLLRRGRQYGQPRAASPLFGASRRSRRVASGSFDGCPADRTPGLAEFWSLQRRPPADSCGAKLATTDSAAARTKAADRTGNSERVRWEWVQRTRRRARRRGLGNSASQLEACPEAVTQTLRQNMARALRADPSRTGCGRVSSSGDSARSRTIGTSATLVRLGRRYGTLWSCRLCRWNALERCRAAGHGDRADDARLPTLYGAA